MKSKHNQLMQQVLHEEFYSEAFSWAMYSMMCSCFAKSGDAPYVPVAAMKMLLTGNSIYGIRGSSSLPSSLTSLNCMCLFFVHYAYDPFGVILS